MALFNQLYQIKGKHADMVRELKKCLGGDSCRNLDIFYISIVLGLWQNLRTNVDDSPKIEPAKIDSEQMVRYNSDIEYLYELVMLSDTRYCPSPKERANKAFRYKGTDKAERDEEHFTQVMLGGLEFLYDSVAQNTSSPEDVFNNIYDLVEGFDLANDISEDSLL